MKIAALVVVVLAIVIGLGSALHLLLGIAALVLWVSGLVAIASTSRLGVVGKIVVGILALVVVPVVGMVIGLVTLLRARA